MYRQILLAIGLLVAVNCQAQVTMTLQVPPTGVMLKQQLWNMSLVYTGDNPINVLIKFTLSGASDDQPLLTATTGIITLSKGAKQLQATDLAPIQYTYLSSAIADRDPNGFLTVGSYEGCYTVLLNDEVGTPLTEDCVSFDVEPLSPPVLNTPADGDTLLTSYPQLAWLPPTPLNLFSNLSYLVNVVEVQAGQNPADAIQQNIPLYSNHSCSDIFVNYPSSGTTLDTGKLYAWQVVAQNNYQPAAQSEVWTFRIAGTNFSLPSTDIAPFVKLRMDQDASSTICTGAVKFYYSNNTADSTMSYRITGADDNTLNTVVKSGDLPMQFGENRVTVSLLNDDRLLNNGAYLFELTNSRNEKWTLKFIYKEPVLTNGE